MLSHNRATITYTASYCISFRNDAITGSLHRNTLLLLTTYMCRFVFSHSQ